MGNSSGYSYNNFYYIHNHTKNIGKGCYNEKQKKYNYPESKISISNLTEYYGTLKKDAIEYGRKNLFMAIARQQRPTTYNEQSNEEHLKEVAQMLDNDWNNFFDNASSALENFIQNNFLELTNEEEAILLRQISNAQKDTSKFFNNHQNKNYIDRVSLDELGKIFKLCNNISNTLSNTGEKTIFNIIADKIGSYNNKRKGKTTILDDISKLLKKQRKIQLYSQEEIDAAEQLMQRLLNYQKNNKGLLTEWSKQDDKKNFENYFNKTFLSTNMGELIPLKRRIMEEQGKNLNLELDNMFSVTQSGKTQLPSYVTGLSKSGKSDVLLETQSTDGLFKILCKRNGKTKYELQIDMTGISNKLYISQMSGGNSKGEDIVHLGGPGFSLFNLFEHKEGPLGRMQERYKYLMMNELASIDGKLGSRLLIELRDTVLRGYIANLISSRDLKEFASVLNINGKWYSVYEILKQVLDLEDNIISSKSPMQVRFDKITKLTQRNEEIQNKDVYFLSDEFEKSFKDIKIQGILYMSKIANAKITCATL